MAQSCKLEGIQKPIKEPKDSKMSLTTIVVLSDREEPGWAAMFVCGKQARWEVLPVVKLTLRYEKLKRKGRREGTLDLVTA